LAGDRFARRCRALVDGRQAVAVNLWLSHAAGVLHWSKSPPPNSVLGIDKSCKCGMGVHTLCSAKTLPKHFVNQRFKPVL
jgi:hypothetical protein